MSAGYLVMSSWERIILSLIMEIFELDLQRQLERIYKLEHTYTTRSAGLNVFGCVSIYLFYCNIYNFIMAKLFLLKPAV